MAKEVKLFIEDNGNREYEDTDELLRMLKEEYDKPRTITLQLSDIEGQVVVGRCNLVVRTCENGEFILTVNVDDVYFLKED